MINEKQSRSKQLRDNGRTTNSSFLDQHLISYIPSYFSSHPNVKKCNAKENVHKYVQWMTIRQMTFQNSERPHLV